MDVGAFVVAKEIFHHGNSSILTQVEWLDHVDITEMPTITHFA